jgi:hypothetical protein
MPCDICRNSPIPGFLVIQVNADETGRPAITYAPCPNDCIGRVASCCDAAGSAQPPRKSDAPNRK